MADLVAPRLFGIVATEAPVVAVLRRGPTDWCQLSRWAIGAGPGDDISVEHGAWLHGTIVPQKCDLSPDGRWFAYSAAKQGRVSPDWAGGEIYEAISRLPWLTALAAWEAGTTYTRGNHFTTSGVDELGPPDAGDTGPCLTHYGLAVTPGDQFAVERRRGWVEAPGTPPRRDGGAFDERRSVTMTKPRPGDHAGPAVSLEVSGGYAAFRTMPEWYDPASYALVGDDDLVVLDDVQWADWSADGRLLVATTAGHLQVRSLAPDLFGGAGPGTAVFDEDVTPLSPDPPAATVVGFDVVRTVGDCGGSALD